MHLTELRPLFDIIQKTNMEGDQRARVQSQKITSAPLNLPDCHAQIVKDVAQSCKLERT